MSSLQPKTSALRLIWTIKVGAVHSGRPFWDGGFYFKQRGRATAATQQRSDASSVSPKLALQLGCSLVVTTFYIKSSELEPFNTQSIFYTPSIFWCCNPGDLIHGLWPRTWAAMLAFMNYSSNLGLTHSLTHAHKHSRTWNVSRTVVYMQRRCQGWLIWRSGQAGGQILGKYFPLGITNVLYWQEEALSRVGGVSGHLTLDCDVLLLSTNCHMDVVKKMTWKIAMASGTKTENSWLASIFLLPAILPVTCPLSLFAGWTHLSMQAFVHFSALSPLTPFLGNCVHITSC